MVYLGMSNGRAHSRIIDRNTAVVPVAVPVSVAAVAAAATVSVSVILTVRKMQQLFQY